MAAAHNAFEEPPPRIAVRLLPAATVVAGSLVTIWPMITSFPILPPFGLLMLLGWKLMRDDVFPVWAALPLGFIDDLLSGQPLGCSMLLWTLCFLMIDLIDQRLVYRDYWQDWLIAAGSIGFCLIGGRLIAAPIGAHVDTVLLLQIMITFMLFPLASRLCDWLDRKREGA